MAAFFGRLEHFHVFHEYWKFSQWIYGYQWWALRFEWTERGELFFGFLRLQSKSAWQRWRQLNLLRSKWMCLCTKPAYQKPLKFRYERVPATYTPVHLSTNLIRFFLSLASHSKAVFLRCSYSLPFLLAAFWTKRIPCVIWRQRAAMRAQLAPKRMRKNDNRDRLFVAFFFMCTRCLAALNFFVMHFIVRASVRTRPTKKTKTKTILLLLPKSRNGISRCCVLGTLPNLRIN